MKLDVHAGSQKRGSIRQIRCGLVVGVARFPLCGRLASGAFIYGATRS